MFGIFKNLTPEGRLENEIKQSMENQIISYTRETNKNDYLMGFAIDAATRDIYKSYMVTANLLSRGHGISYEKTVSIITKVTNDIRNKYLVNPTPIS